MTDEIPAWGNVKQLETVGQTESGSFVEGVKVTFTTRAGVTGSIFVPRSEYTTDHVRDLINAKAATIDEISALSG